MDESKLGNAVCLEDDGGGADRLSGLCDDLLLKILSYLSLKQAGQTHGLSRRWRHLWSFRKDLDFKVGESKTSTDVSTSVELVNNVLAHYKGPKIGSFRLDIHSNMASDEQIDSWVRFAIDRDVEDIWLALCYYKDPYNVTSELYHGKFLRSLHLHDCNLPVIDCVCLSSLKDLSLTRANFPRDFLPKFTSRCPVLKEVYLNRCNIYSDIFVHITNPSVQILIVRDYALSLYEVNGLLDIFAPSILYFKLRGVVRCKSILVNVSYLVVAEVDLQKHSSADVFFLEKLLGSLTCEKLLLGNWCIQIFARSRSTKLFSQLPFECLSLRLPLLKCETSGLLYLLQISPKVECLTIHFGLWDDGINEESHLWSSTFKFSFLHYMIDSFQAFEVDEADFDMTNNAELDTCLSGKLRRLKTIELKNFYALGFLAAINCNIYMGRDM